MSLYDDYFTNDDKPFAENFNDALLLSNVFDLTVPIELPKMFNNGEWSTGTGQRKAGVSIIQTEGIDGSDVVIDTYEDEQGHTVCALMANSDATVLITVYPNFNQYGNLQKVYWEFEEGLDENLTVDVLTEQRTALLTNIPNNSVLSSVPYLQQLNRFILRLNFEGGTGIKKLGFIMQNKQQDRYGAEVGINDVNGLNDRFANLETSITENYNALDTAKVDKVAGKQLSTNDFTNEYKADVDTYTECSEEHITYWDNMEYTDGLSNNPLVIEKVGRVFHLHGTWKTSSSISIRSQASKVLGLFSSPSPNYPIYSSQLITKGGSYEIMVSPDRKIELTNVAKSSDLTIPANTVCYVNVMWILEG